MRVRLPQTAPYMNKNDFGNIDLFFDIEKLPTHGPNPFHWSWHEFDMWQDGSYSETQGVGYHITKWKIVKGNYIASMREESFYVGDSFAIRPIELITLERQNGHHNSTPTSPKLEG